MKIVIIDIPDTGLEEGMLKDYESGSLFDKTIHNALKKAVVLKTDATNGDVITSLFPNIKVSRIGIFTVYADGDGLNKEAEFILDWWDRPYKFNYDEVAVIDENL